MKRFFLAIAAMLSLVAISQQAVAADWFDVMSYGGETISISPDITTTDNGQNYLVWVRNSFDMPEVRSSYARERGYNSPVAYKLTLYKFTDQWNNFNIVQVSVYGENGDLIDQYTNPDMASTESVIPAGSSIEGVAEAAKVIYEVKTNPE